MMKSKNHTFLLLIWILLIGTGSTFAFSGYGSGTKTDPFVITNVYQLQEMRDNLTAYYILGNDIDATDTASWNDGQGFEPIGVWKDEMVENAFTGTFDGRGHSIDGLYINRINDRQQGLFGVILYAAVKNVNVINADVSGDIWVGILAGWASRESIVISCAATGTITLKAGLNDSKSGGLIGGVVSGSRVAQCFSDVRVKAGSRKQVGGMIGYLAGTKVKMDLSNEVIRNTYLTNSFSYGAVIGNGAKQGNLVGDADGAKVDRCYSCGGKKALIGHNYRSPIITNCYWDKDTGAYSSPYGGTPKTSEQMASRDTFENWDFDEIWGIDESESYPYLKKWAN
jgi:hypothetical protein